MEQKYFWRLEQQEEKLLDELKELDNLQDERDLNDEEMMIRSTIVVELEELAKNEESSWRQKSRVLWLKEGDKNTKFFQRMANAHRKFKAIDRLIVDDVEVVDKASITQQIVNFYTHLYSETESWRPSFDYSGGPKITVEEEQNLQRPFTEAEVLTVLKLCDGDKAPGPDGFTIAFVKACWEILKQDFMGVIHSFHQEEAFEKTINATFVALIPKRNGADKLKDFRPISLIGIIYKIISKLLTERLKSVMGKLIDDHQLAFMKGRQIMDAALLANELVDTQNKQRMPGVLCKLDLEKAYDHVNRRFLLNILKDTGFGVKWIKWIQFCISTVKFSIIVNGNPEGFFQSHRGLRQGDPLSPFLFIIAMEGMNHMFKVASTNGWLKGFGTHNRVGENMEISHLLYADDTLIFCNAEVEQVRHIRLILTVFQALSGLKG